MLPYFLLITPIAFMAAYSPIPGRTRILWLLAFLAILIFVGLRHHVGMDWGNYLAMIRRVNAGGFGEAITVVEPAYAALLWLSGRLGVGIYGAHLVGTFIFLGGLFRYAKMTPAPWIAILVAMPFLVIVVGMSASRQAVAIGVLLYLTAEWSGCSASKRLLLVMLASSFHMSAVGFLAFVYLDLRIAVWMKWIGSLVMLVAIMNILQFSGHAAYYGELYGTGQSELTQSSGALMHVMLNAGPALVSFFIGRRARNILIPDILHKQMAIIAIALIPLSFLMSAASGRLTLYFFPVSIWFFASLPLLFEEANLRAIVKFASAIFFIGLLTLWLTAGNAASAHANYRNALFTPTEELVLCCG